MVRSIAFGCCLQVLICSGFVWFLFFFCSSYPKGNYYVQTFKYPPYNNASCQHATAGATATVSMEW